VPAEQLRYSWSEEGLGGYNMFQPVGVSSGLRDLNSKSSRLALRLCRYDYAPGDPAPPRSFGWVDSGHLRFAFSRCFLPDDQVGHPGNFAAQIVVARRDELPISLLLETRNSSAWWRGGLGGKDRNLQPIDFLGASVAAESSLRDPQAAQVLLAEIVSGVIHVESAFDPDITLGAMTSIVDSFPQLVEERSFSSFEFGDSRKWFDIVGCHSAQERRPDKSGVELAAARFVLSGAASQAQLSAVMGSDSRDIQAIRRFRAIAASMESLRQKEASSASGILIGLQTASAIDRVLSFPNARVLIANAIWSGDSATLSAVTRNGAFISGVTWQLLGEEFAVASGVTPSASRTQALLNRFPEEFSIGAAVGFLRSATLSGLPANARTWPPALIFAALLVEPGSPAEALAVRDAAGACGVDTWLAEPRILLQRRLNLFEDLVSRGVPLNANHLLAASEVLISEMRLGTPSWSKALSCLDPTRAAEIILAALKNDGDAPMAIKSSVKSTIRSVAAAAPASVSISLIAQVAKSLVRKGESWSNFEVEMVWRYLREAAIDPSLPLSIARTIAGATSAAGPLSSVIALAGAAPLRPQKLSNLITQTASSDQHVLLQLFIESALETSEIRVDTLYEYLRTEGCDATLTVNALSTCASRALTSDAARRGVCWPILEFFARVAAAKSDGFNALVKQPAIVMTVRGTFQRLLVSDPQAAHNYLRWLRGHGRSSRNWLMVLGEK
jgi:hypothetical protein